MNRKILKGFFRGFYITVLTLGMLILVALGTQLAQENPVRVGYGESCLPQQSSHGKMACIFLDFMS